MGQPPTYRGTKGREPCPLCEGRGILPPIDNPMSRLTVCVACNGTKVRPLTSSEASGRRSGRAAGIRRAQRGH